MRHMSRAKTNLHTCNLVRPLVKNKMDPVGKVDASFQSFTKLHMKAHKRVQNVLQMLIHLYILHCNWYRKTTQTAVTRFN